MPSVKFGASKLLNEYGEARSELIGKAVALIDGKAGTVENVWLHELYGHGISIKGWTMAGLDHQVHGELDPRIRARAAQSAPRLLITTSRVSVSIRLHHW